MTPLKKPQRKCQNLKTAASQCKMESLASSCRISKGAPNILKAENESWNPWAPEGWGWPVRTYNRDIIRVPSYQAKCHTIQTGFEKRQWAWDNYVPVSASIEIVWGTYFTASSIRQLPEDACGVSWCPKESGLQPDEAYSITVIILCSFLRKLKSGHVQGQGYCYERQGERISWKGFSKVAPTFVNLHATFSHCWWRFSWRHLTAHALALWETSESRGQVNGRTMYDVWSFSVIKSVQIYVLLKWLHSVIRIFSLAKCYPTQPKGRWRHVSPELVCLETMLLAGWKMLQI